MDKNTLTGIILIIAVLVGFSYLNKPNQEQLDAQRRTNDSIAIVQQANELNAGPTVGAPLAGAQNADTQGIANTQNANAQGIANTQNANDADSTRQSQLVDTYGAFAAAAEGDEKIVTMGNDLLEVKISTHGGQIQSVRLKKFTDYEKEPLYLFGIDESSFELTFTTANNRVLNTKDFYFEPIPQTANKLVLRLHADTDQTLDFIYTMHPDDYLVDFDIQVTNLETVLSPSAPNVYFKWAQKIRQQEKGRKWEERYSRLTYKFLTDEFDELKDSKDDQKDITNRLKWIGYKNQFFSSVLISKKGFESAHLESRVMADGKYEKEYFSSITVPFEKAAANQFIYFFGPNKYSLLKSYDSDITKFAPEEKVELEKLVPLGWKPLFRPINKYLIIPVFDWLTSWCTNIGLAILLLTLIIRGVLFPLTYKSLMSSAKMRVLKPQVQAITDKYPGQENAITRQQKTMELYKQVGASPMAGCLPMLIQMPFLFALFVFFPTAIELRHKGFWFADDMSTYDSLISFGTNVPIIGDHISIFCLMMTLLQLLNTRISMSQQATGQEQMPGMSLMMYLMPVMMFFVLNSYPAGLNWYYSVSSLITVAQTVGFRYLVDEDRLLLKLEANKKKTKPAKKKSGFMARLEEAQRQQQALLKERQKQQNKKGKR
ncbi:MAG: membrane protein insertase YidC [Candidatus Symbiothrix sp.]|jgi:YidC/Oxa1 family membrane protein insertase|nr:membrane protein insertase YidC [Candidatus Symbiothrix sp.]